MGDWWIDDEPYPGPAFRTPQEELDALATTFTHLGRRLGKSMSLSMGAAAHALVEAANAMKSALPPIEEANKVLNKPPSNHGPRPAQHWNRHGKRTF